MSTRLALVTGASAGIGRATARALARDGWTVIAVARRAERLADLVAERPDRLHALACDCGDGEQVLAMAARVLEEHGAPDVIVHCAGAGAWKWIEDTTPSDLQGMMAAPFFAAFHVNHAFMAPMLARRSGLLVHVNSPVSRLPWAGATGYASCRWAMRGLHEALVQDLRGTGVATSHVVLGEVTSEYFDAHPGSHERIPKIARIVPTLTPEDSAEIIVGAIRRPRRELVRPLMLRLFYLIDDLAPWLVRALVGSTSATRG